MQADQISTEVYNDIVQSHPERLFPLEQSPAWNDFQTKIPGRHSLGSFAFKNNDNVVAVATLLQLTMRGYSYIWVNQGPVWLTTPEAKTTASLFGSLRSLAQEKATTKALFLRAHSSLAPPKALPAYSKSLIQKTTIVDLTKDFPSIMAGMSQGARRGMRKAEKAGVTIQEVPAKEAAADFAPYYDILVETAKRDGFFVHPISTYRTMLESLAGIVRFFVAYQAGQPVAWAIDTVYTKRAIYYYGASSTAGRDAMAPYLLHIEIMRTLQAEGVKSYDFLGIGSKSFPGLQGVTQFKLRFGGDVVDYAPVYDFPLSPAYHPWKWAQGLRRILHK